MSATTQIHNDAPKSCRAICLRNESGGRAFIVLDIGAPLAQVAAEWFLSGEEAIATAAMLRKVADDLDAAAVDARDSDLFHCPICKEHFTSRAATPICESCKTYKVLNVPEDTIYCGTCNRGASSVDEDGCCSDCAEAGREAALNERQEHAAYQRAVL
jgi:hypothetical protein